MGSRGRRRAESKRAAGGELPPADPIHAAGSSRSRAALRIGVEIGLVVAAALLALYRTRERDFWFHLAAGRSIVQHGLPSSERWCLAAYGQWPWLGEWLYHVSLYGVRAAAGDVGIGVWRAAWAGLAVALALAVARKLRAGLWSVALMAPLVLAVTRDRLAARPEQTTLAFLLLFLLVFEHARQSGRDRTAWLLPAQIVWANFHPGWILGPLVAGIYAALAIRRGATPRPRALRWALLAIALYAAGGVTPQPLDTLSLRLMRDVGADPMKFTIEELRAWRWTEDRFQPFTALVALALAAAALGGKRAWRASPPLALAAVASLAAGLTSFRLRAMGGIVAWPMLAVALDPAGPRPGGRVRPAAMLVRALTGCAALAGVAWLVADVKYYSLGTAPHVDAVPVRAVELADSLRLDGPVLNTTEYGGYILWIRGERHLPIQDTRHLGSNVFRSRFVRARLDSTALDTLLADWRFTHAIIEPPMDPVDRLAQELFHHRGWALVFADDAGLLYVRRDLSPALASARAYRVMSPDYTEMAALATRALEDTVVRRALTAELERARAESPWHARASLWLGLIKLARGRPREALADLDEVERLAPITPGLALRQGYAREQVGDVVGARRAFRRALRDTSDQAAARAALDRLSR